MKVKFFYLLLSSHALSFTARTTFFSFNPKNNNKETWWNETIYFRNRFVEFIPIWRKKGKTWIDTKLLKFFYYDIIIFYLKGGGSLFAIHNESEVYNPRTDRWSPLPPMVTRRSRAGVASLGKVLYVVGGYASSILKRNKIKLQNLVWCVSNNANN